MGKLKTVKKNKEEKKEGKLLRQVSAAARGMETKTIRRNLQCNLTQDELLSKGAELSQTMVDIAQLNERKAVQAREMSEEIKKKTGVANNLVRIVNSGMEMRMVECEKMMNYAEGHVLVRRLDNGEVLEERPMTEDERQLPLLVEEEEEVDETDNEDVITEVMERTEES